MDSITHGLAGALVGKAFYAGRRGPEAPLGTDRTLAWVQTRRVAVFAATLGAVFPDSDILFAIFQRGNGAGLEIHRGVTHSFVCLPLFAVVLALLTRWIARRRGLASPSLRLLLLIYASVLALHIFMDLITSWGTMIWSPLSRTRAAWDLTFIIDLTVTTILLLPQIAARSYRSPGHGWMLRGGALVIFGLAAWIEYSYAGLYPVPLITAIVIYATVLFAPAIRGWGFRIPRQTWCRAGFAAFALYMGLQAVAHQSALGQVRQFAQARGLQVERVAALPMPPSLFAWNGMIRASDGLYHASLAWPSKGTPHFEFAPDSPSNHYIEAAKRTPAAQRFLWFARFPSIAYSQDGPLHYVDFSDRRFSSSRRNHRPYTVRITLDDSGTVVEQQWAED